MGKSLGEYNIEKSSSSDLANIKWTQKHRADSDKPKTKRKKARNTSPFNIIYPQDDQEAKLPSENVFKIAKTTIAGKSKDVMKGQGRKFQNSSASNCKIKQGFTRPAR